MCRSYLGWAFVVVFVLIAPNLMSLSTSTVRVENASDSSIESIAYLACETTHIVGTLRPHQFIFRFLEACGDDTLEIQIGDSKFRQIYVEGELYLDATIH